jgi:putative flippase GtrA
MCLNWQNYQLLIVLLRVPIKINFAIENSVIPQYTSNRFMSFRKNKMHKLITVFHLTSQFSHIRAPSSRK